MNNKNTMLWTKKTIFFALVLSTVALASCGGGSSTTAPITAPIAVTPPSTTVINGISVPPEPDAILNKATIAGVDSNNNGVRDDVERVVATNYGADAQKYDMAMKFAKSEQALIVTKTSNSRDDYLKQVQCGSMKAKESDILTTKLLDTPDRKKAYAEVLVAVVLEGCK